MFKPMFALLGAIALGVSFHAFGLDQVELPEQAPALSAGLLGSKEAELYKSEFFSFFHIRANGPVAQQGRYTIKSYGTSGDFKAFLQFKVTYDPQGKAVRIQALVAREFIDDVELDPFARDIMRSFVHDATPKNDQAAVSGLLDEISFFNVAHGRTIIMGGDEAKGKEKLLDGETEPSAGYKVVQGKAPDFMQKNKECVLTIGGAEIDGKRWVEFTVTASVQ